MPQIIKHLIKRKMGANAPIIRYLELENNTFRCKKNRFNDDEGPIIARG